MTPDRSTGSGIDGHTACGLRCLLSQRARIRFPATTTTAAAAALTLIDEPIASTKRASGKTSEIFTKGCLTVRCRGVRLNISGTGYIYGSKRIVQCCPASDEIRFDLVRLIRFVRSFSDESVRETSFFVDETAELKIEASDRRTLTSASVDLHGLLGLLGDSIILIGSAQTNTRHGRRRVSGSIAQSVKATHAAPPCVRSCATPYTSPYSANDCTYQLESRRPRLHCVELGEISSN